jgi:ATP-dependent DNA helicase RecG
LRNLYEADRRIDNEPDTFPGLEPWLGQKGIVRRAGGAWMPTAAGVLVWGLDPQSQFPGATIEFARYAGTDFDAALVTRRTSAGRLADQLETLWAQLQANVAEVPAEAVGIRTPVVPEYPVDALKELARNLVQHRLYDGTNAPGRVSWFDDRIVFNNPGQPFGHASDGEFGEHSDYRNPTITRLLMEAGYVERLGRGVRKVRALLQKNGNPPLDVQTNGYTTVMVGRRR